MHLAEHGVQTMIHYPVPPHQQQAYHEKFMPNYLLPIGPLASGKSLQRVIECMGAI